MSNPIALLALVGVAFLAFHKRKAIKGRLHKFDYKYKVSDDLSFLLPIAYQAVRHAYQTLVSHRYNQFYDIEKTATSKKYCNKVAINYIRLKPGKRYQIDGDEAFAMQEYTYREMYDIVLRLSYILHEEYGIEKGDTVTMYFMNKPLFIFIWLALWNIGALPAFLNYNLKHNPLVHSIKVVNSKCVLVDTSDCLKDFKESEDEIKKALPSLNIYYLNDVELMKRISDPATSQFRQLESIRDKDVKAYSPALLVYTSGTTGMPKSAVNSWRKVFFAAYFFPIPMMMDDDMNMYTSMPLYHGTGAILGVLPTFECRGTLSLGHKFSVSTFWAQIRLTHSNTIQYVGETCR